MRRVPKEAQESGDGRSRAALLVDDWMQAQLDSINAADTIVWRQFSNRRNFSSATVMAMARVRAGSEYEGNPNIWSRQEAYMWHYLSRPLDAYTVEITEIAAACNEVHIYYTSSGSRVNLKQSAFVPGASGTVLETLMVEAGTSSNRRVTARNIFAVLGR